MKPAARSGRVVLLGMFAIVLLIALPAFAYQYPLSSSDIRNAYLLGYAKDLNTTNFFAPYARQFPTPDSGPHIATITLKTPYGQMVELGQSALNADVQGAEEEYASKKLPFLVQVEVDLTATYPDPASSDSAAPGAPLPDFQRDFPARLVQDGQNVPRAATQVYLLYSDSAFNTYSVSGAIIEYRYDPDKIDPDDAATFEVHTPDGQDIETTFDLGRLR
ncbi:MAG: hypothetical protein WBS17_13190 [Candidatus Acidiferrales bacterium]